MYEKIFFASLKSPKTGAGSGVGSGAGSINQRYGSADPDPYQNVMDPQHCQKDKIVIYFFIVL